MDEARNSTLDDYLKSIGECKMMALEAEKQAELSELYARETRWWANYKLGDEYEYPKDSP